MDLSSWIPLPSLCTGLYRCIILVISIVCGGTAWLSYVIFLRVLCGLVCPFLPARIKENNVWACCLCVCVVSSLVDLWGLLILLLVKLLNSQNFTPITVWTQTHCQTHRDHEFDVVIAQTSVCALFCKSFPSYFYSICDVVRRISPKHGCLLECFTKHCTCNGMCVARVYLKGLPSLWQWVFI